MIYILLLIVAIALVAFAIQRNHNLEVDKREVYIDNFKFPVTLSEKLVEKYPHLSDLEVEKVIKGLREYFHICNRAGSKMVSMPSQAVDLVWHEFILFTKMYQEFCDKAFGRFLHHTPAEAMKSAKVAQGGIVLAWRISCYRENIESNAPYKVPLLFAMDADLKIPDGFKYSLNCELPGSHEFCAAHIDDSDYSGCGGGGCGGGCGGD